MATPSIDDLICLMATEAKVRREEATEAGARREKKNQHRLEMAKMEQRQVVELKTEGQGKRHPKFSEDDGR